MRTTNLVSSIIVALCSILLLAWIIPSHSAPAQSPLDIPPARLPSMAIWICLITAVVLGLGALRAKPGGVQAEDEEFGDSATGIGAAELVRMAILIALVVATIIAMPLAGFEITMGVLLLAMMVFLCQRNYALLAAVALVVPIGLSQLAWHVFTVEFP
ncbi:MAG: tripartite tricarboxylate transporter TctB family protein [Alphaproteobacteria bacterium]|nr:tripartite tricarboxylate transporter TctB family protein [Alphaproteobacteria bacterium]